MNISLEVFIWFCLVNKHLGMECLDHLVCVRLTSLESTNSFPKCLYRFTYPPEFQFLHIIPNAPIVCTFYYTYYCV